MRGATLACAQSRKKSSAELFSPGEPEDVVHGVDEQPVEETHTVGFLAGVLVETLVRFDTRAFAAVSRENLVAVARRRD